MCRYCERRTDIKYGWEQPRLYDKAQNELDDNIHGNVSRDLEGYIHDYQTTTPELIIKSKELATELCGGTDGVATIYIPIHYCPICGRKLGRKEEKNE